MPQGLLDEPVAPETEDYQHYDAQYGENQVHPPFAQEIEPDLSGLRDCVIVLHPSCGEGDGKEDDDRCQHDSPPRQAAPFRILPGRLLCRICLSFRFRFCPVLFCHRAFLSFCCHFGLRCRHSGRLCRHFGLRCRHSGRLCRHSGLW